MPFYPEPTSVRLVIVCGPPRCGTRFITDAINAHPEAMILSEVTETAMDACVRMIAEIDGEGREHRRWRERRSQVVFAMWRAAQRLGSKKEASTDTKIFGYKSPRHEKYWSFYAEIFARSTPTFVYCIRRFSEHYLSCAARWPRRSIEGRARDYLSSFERYREMRASSAVRVVPFVLDKLGEGGKSYLADVLTQVDESFGAIAESIDIGRRANSSEMLGFQRRHALDDEERAFIRAHPEIETLFEQA